MIKQLLERMDKLGMIKSARAHCDIPCGIYDPMPALIAALSVVRMTDILIEHGENTKGTLDLQHAITRNAQMKEEEAEKVKHEIRIIWGDYFKGDLLKKYPDIHDLAHSIMVKGSSCKQEVHREDGVALVELVNQFAEKFWDSKGVKTERRKAPYAPGLDIVYPAG